VGQLLREVAVFTGGTKMIETINESRPICEAFAQILFHSTEGMTSRRWELWRSAIKMIFSTGAVEIVVAAVGDKKDEWVALEMELKEGPNGIPEIFQDFPTDPVGTSHDGHERMIEWFFEKHPCPDSLHNHVRLSSFAPLSCHWKGLIALDSSLQEHAQPIRKVWPDSCCKGNQT